MPGLDDLVVRRTTTAQHVADGLSELILGGEFAPGVRLRESAIAARVGVSRNTVREAMRILELGGLVRHEVNRGAVVIPVTVPGVTALYTARERLETAAVQRTPRPEQLERLEASFDALTGAAASRDVDRIVQDDLAFHGSIVSLLDSSRLDAFYADLTLELRFYLTVLTVEDRQFERPDEVVAEHEPILAAVRAGDHARAAATVHDHIESSVRRLTAMLAERDQADLPSDEPPPAGP